MNLIDITQKFKSEDDCLDYIEAMRWPDGVKRCPTCGNDKLSVIERKKVSKNVRNRFYQCLEKSCKQQFSATSGTVFHDTHLPLTKWFLAIGLICDAKKGIAANQLARHLDVQYRTAWHLCHRIRKAMQDTSAPKLTGVVEVDEVYLGGKQRGHKGKQTNKDVVIGIRERNGDLRLVHTPDSKQGTVYDAIAANVAKSVEAIVTDDSRIYNFNLTQYQNVPHFRINHSGKKYVRTDRHVEWLVHTNTIENAFSLLKRGIIGNYHFVSIKHLQRYLNEFTYRFNRRQIADMFSATVRQLAGFSPLTYRELVSEQS